MRRCLLYTSDAADEGLAGLEAWESGVLIQDALPELSASEREQLMTGIHAECWDRAFPEEEV